MTRTCLIAEADPFIARLLQRFAEESDLLSVRVTTGQEIMPLVQRLSPDVLVVEPELPGEIRGWEAVRTMRSSGALGSMAVISCSWLDKAESCRLIGDVAWHLQKPDLCHGDFTTALAAAGVAARGPDGANMTRTRTTMLRKPATRSRGKGGREKKPEPHS